MSKTGYYWDTGKSKDPNSEFAGYGRWQWRTTYQNGEICGGTDSEFRAVNTLQNLGCSEIHNVTNEGGQQEFSATEETNQD